MNLYDAILASRPLTAFKLNDAGTDYVDITNRSVDLTPDSTFAFTAPIIVGGVSKSLIAANGNRSSFNKGIIYRRGYERQPWSAEVWIGPINIDSGYLGILSHEIDLSDPQDGIWLDHDFIHFTIEFDTLDPIDLKWPMPDALEVWHVAVIYTPAKVQLYINGEVVDEADISEEQLADGFKSISDTFHIGRSSGTISAAVDGIAIYGKALTDAAIYRHWRAGRRSVPAQTIAGAFGGNSFDGTSRDIYTTKVWTTRDDWADGAYTDIEFESGYLRPTEDPVDQVSLEGEWIGIYETASVGTNLFGVQVDWDGDGNFVVEASIDEGDNWIELANGEPIDGTYDWDSTDINVLVRITFAGGVEFDLSTVRRLRVTSFTSPYVYGTDVSRLISITEGVATCREANEPIEFNIFSGFRTTAVGETITIEPDTETEDPRDIGAVELWVKFNGTQTDRSLLSVTGASLSSSSSDKFDFSGGDLFVNAESVSDDGFDTLPDTWYHLVFNLDSTTNDVITIEPGGDVQIALVNTYSENLSSTDVSRMYAMYSGYPTASLGAEEIDVEEASDPYRIYGFDWAMQSVGV